MPRTSSAGYIAWWPMRLSRSSRACLDGPMGVPVLTSYLDCAWRLYSVAHGGNVRRHRDEGGGVHAERDREKPEQQAIDLRIIQVIPVAFIPEARARAWAVLCGDHREGDAHARRRASICPCYPALYRLVAARTEVPT